MKTALMMLAILLRMTSSAAENSQAFGERTNLEASYNTNLISKNHQDSHRAGEGYTAYNTNLIAKYNKEIIDACSWGSSSTNGLRMGLLLPGGNGQIVESFLTITNAAGLCGPAPAPHGYRLDLSLLDGDGKQIARTAKGDALCHKVGWMMRRTMTINQWRGAFFLSPGKPRPYDDAFDVLDCFSVEKPGNYTLRVSGALYWRTWPVPAEAVPLEIPASTLKVTITQSDLDIYRRNSSE